jgi:protoheme IX farnesyltransferase
LGYAGIASGVSAIVAGALMLGLAWRARSRREGERARRAAQRLFSYSIVYLFVVFAALLAEAVITSHLGRVAT